MNCSEFLAQLGDFIDNQVPTGLVPELRAHLEGCDHCVITMQTTQKTIEIYRNHEVYELPAGLRERLQIAILAKCKKARCQPVGTRTKVEAFVPRVQLAPKLQKGHPFGMAFSAKTVKLIIFPSL